MMEDSTAEENNLLTNYLAESTIGYHPCEWKPPVSIEDSHIYLLATLSVFSWINSTRYCFLLDPSYQGQDSKQN
jgi:hypothetical protein